MRAWGRVGVVSALMVLAGTSRVWAEGRSVSPFIDAVKQDLEKEEIPDAARTVDRPQPFIDAEKNKLPPEEDSFENYTERLRSAQPQEKIPGEGFEGYTDREKARLGGTSTPGGAIGAVQRGDSDLKRKYEGRIHHAFSLKVGASATRSYSVIAAKSSGYSFEQIYGNSWVPDVMLSYEYQLFHNEYAGSLGIVLNGGVTYHNAKGKFAVPLTNPAPSAAAFPLESRTKFQFFTIPVGLGANYRFNLFRFIRPYGQVVPTLIGFSESRNDNKASANTSVSRAIVFSGGVNFFLTPIFRDASWSLYESGGVKNYFLTVDFSRLTTIGGDVTLKSSILSAGLTYEF